jgi:hypothetical protein
MLYFNIIMRQKIIVLLISIALFSSLKLAKQELSVKFHPAGGDEISSYEKRFYPLKGMMPVGAVVGYVTDIPSQGVVSDAAALARYYVTQYALAPTIVVNTIEQPVVVGDFHGDPLVSNKDAISALLPRMDLGNGVILFTRKEK